MAVNRALVGSVVASAVVYGVGTFLGVPAIAAAATGGAVDPTAVIGALLGAATAADLLKATGAHFIATLGVEGWSRACDRLATGNAAIDDPLRAALVRAFDAAAAEIKAAWLETPEAQRLRSRHKEIFDGAESVLVGLGEGGELFVSTGPSDQPAKHGELRYALDGGDPSRRATFEKRLRAFAGLDPAEDPTNVVGFIVERLPPAFARRFAEELKCDGAAWQALQVILARDTRVALADLARQQQVNAAELDEIGARLDRWDQRLAAAAANPSSQSVSQEQAAIEKVLQSAIDTATTTLLAAIDRAEANILARVDQVREDLQRLQSTQTTGLTWIRPVAPPLEAGDLFFGREDDLAEVKRLIVPGTVVDSIVAVHGMPGVGKTTLARHVAADPPAWFTGGVLYAALGNTFHDPLLAGPILIRWARHAFAMADPPPGFQPDPVAVRALLANHGPLLIVLDDVWDRRAIRPLLEARPPDATVLITTRDDALAADLASERVYWLGVLPLPAAVDLLRARARATARQEPILASLAASLGCHALALDLAGRRLRRIPPDKWQRFADETSRGVVEGTVFAILPVPEEQRERSVEAVLARSYDGLDAVPRARFRQLGAFAPEASFRTEAAGAVWECASGDAGEQLLTFGDQGLLQRVSVQDMPDEARWQQHGLLRAYALALLRVQNEADAARARHAAVHLALMREADDRQVYYRLLPDHPQLVHAFAWAVVHDVSLAVDLAANTANLQAAFGLVRFSHEWATTLLRAVEPSDDKHLYAGVLGTLGNALQRLADTSGEDRCARLREALAAYDAALAIYTPQVAPLDHAMTQNNKGNVLRALAEVPGEDRAARLREALRASWTAFQVFDDLGHERYRRVAMGNLRAIRRAAGKDFPRLWAEFGVGGPPDWLNRSD